MEHYFGEFEKNMEQLKRKLPQLTEGFFVECFISGLTAEIRNAMLLLAPDTVESAFRKAKQCAETRRYSSPQEHKNSPSNGKVSKGIQEGKLL